MQAEPPLATRIDAGALNIGALLYGEESAPPMIILHGHTDTAWSMDSVARPLAERYRVISLDLRGHGASDRGAYTLLHMVGDLKGVIDELDLVDPIVIGHSLGGQVAAQFCGIYPEIPRAGVFIEAIGPPAFKLARTDPDDHERAFARQRVERIRRRARNRPLADLADAVERVRRAHPLLDPERAALLAEKGTRELADGSREWHFDPASRDWIAGHDAGRAEQRWRGITCPVQVILGADAWDRFWKPNLPYSDELEGPFSEAEIERRLSNFADRRFVRLEGAGHMVHYDRPTELNEVIASFLVERVERTA